MPQAPRGFSFSTCQSVKNGHPQPVPPAETKAERTRAGVLEAAERHFAASGFHAARLEDIAGDVGVKRAALFYHFRDKQALHDAVLRQVLGAVLARLQEIMAGELPFAERAEQAAAGWIDLLAERPTAARLILRELACDEIDWRRLLPIAAPILDWMRHELREAAARDEIDPVDDEPLALLGSLVGATAFAPASEEPLAARRAAAVRHLRRLLGTGGST